MPYFFQPKDSIVNDDGARSLLKDCQVIPGQRPPKIVYRLAYQAAATWTVCGSSCEGALRALTHHKKELVQKKSYSRNRHLSHDESASLAANCFFSNVGVFGFIKTCMAYEALNHNRVRKSSTCPGVFHNHFGTKPEYVFEYQIFPEIECQVLLSTTDPRDSAHIDGPAYVRFQDQLFYVYKKQGICEPLLLDTDASVLQKFDAKLNTPTEENKGRTLTENELKQAALISRFPHLQRILLITNIDPHENFRFQQNPVMLFGHRQDFDSVVQKKLAAIREDSVLLERYVLSELRRANYLAAEATQETTNRVVRLSP